MRRVFIRKNAIEQLFSSKWKVVVNLMFSVVDEIAEQYAIKKIRARVQKWLFSVKNILASSEVGPIVSPNSQS